AYNPDVEYVLVTLDVNSHNRVALNAFLEANPTFELMADPKVLIAKPLLEAFGNRLDAALVSLSGDAQLRLDDFDDIVEIKGSDLAGTIARHPMHKLGGFFAKPRPFLAGDFVTTDQGTGLVHMAPDHGEDDFTLCKANGIGPVFAVEGDGKYSADWAWLGGQGAVINAKFNAPDGPILTDLREAGALLAASDFKHSYPHSWRSKAKVIYRCTPQWFIAMDKPLAHLSPESRAEQRWDSEGGALPPRRSPPAGEGQRREAAQGEGVSPSPAPPLPNPSPAEGRGANLREVALQAIADTRFIPEKGRNRLSAMVEDRPDWVISRQRAWGVPIALFVDRKSGEPLVDREVNARIVAAITEQGVDAWDESSAADFLGSDRDPADYEMVRDILDVWFDSGSTHAFVLESGEWPELSWPADIYVEGSDQHRGWFQSSLLESCGTRGRAPFGALLTHGFTMDSKGMKMSKSLGNTVDPLKVMETYGADIIRLWALSVDFTEDHRIGDEILKGVSDQYRKLRNTFRYLLGALDGFTEGERLDDVAAYPELERYMLSLLAKLDQTLRTATDDFDFNSYVRALTEFCNEDLSAFYFDIRKDCLYCDSPGDPKRRAYRTVLDTLFHALVRWAAPVLVFTAEEVWGTRFPDAGSVHLLEWPTLFLGEGRGPGLDPGLRRESGDWERLRALRTQVTEAIEPLRRDKVIGSSLEAEVVIPEDLDDSSLAELFIVSSVASGESLMVTKTVNHKCGRCWRHLPEVPDDGALCDRCEGVVNG
ncbi:MAG: class I tRNA ligase family protein, partial [Sphingomicrobium sp.]